VSFEKKKLYLLPVIGLILLIAVAVWLHRGSLFNKTTPKKTETVPNPTEIWAVFRGNQFLSGVAFSKLPDKMELLWNFKTEAGITSTPVVSGNYVYVSSRDGRIYALQGEDGKKIWEFEADDAFEASPLLLNDILYVGCMDGKFYAIDSRDGKMKWQYECLEQVSGAANWAKLPDGREVVLFGSYDSNLHCVAAENGSPVWKFETGNYINGTPAVFEGKAVFGGCDALLRLVNIADGEEVAGIDVGAYIPSSPAIGGNMAYFGHYGNQVLGINLIEREISWEYGDPEKGDAFFSSPAVNKKYLLIGGRDGKLHCLDRKNGDLKWFFQAKGNIDASPVISRNKVVFGALDGRLYIVDINDGKKLWSYEIGEGISGAPAVVGGRIYVGGEDGRLYAFGEKAK